MHMQSGRAIVTQHSQRLKHGSRRKDLVEIEHVLARLDVPAICFQDRSSPYPYTLVDFYGTNPCINPGYYQDVQEAQSAFIDLLRWLLLVGEHIDAEAKSGDMRAMARYQIEKTRCAALIQQWLPHFEDAVKRSDPSSVLLVLNLRLWYAHARLLSKAEMYGPESRYDALTRDFEQSMDLGEKLAASLAESEDKSSFSFDLGYIIPVYFVATRCRDPTVRRRAIFVLRHYRRQECVWQSTAAAAVAQAWVNVVSPAQRMKNLWDRS